ncbi:AzlC family ABC transporter permease [Helicobacter sp. MIT 14-3879]|uniref:AzlC family ABC transporter permease n=1 Tax=Helicobacter sp. MIT 14-3879 TaxID=2040649 RepID=UPI000E1F49D3|nr:AzlC family ABC transporter permease [Helicobacter sp. MIT 14-3879]RDU59289.1 azaleucine resistance protein AzlC [Helicobacter sp. MIT 14-3879]
MKRIIESEEFHALQEGFNYSLPILATYVLMGGVFGIMMAAAGYSAWISLLMSVIIYAGAMQFVAVGLLAGDIPLLSVIAICLSINARQFFYAIASLNRYQIKGWRKWYLIFSVTDETFAILNLREQKADTQSHKVEKKMIDNQKVMFYISGFNHCYWIIGCVGGTILGNSLSFIQEVKGLEFIVIATFLVLFYENFTIKQNRISIYIGMIATTVCLLLNREHFLLYSLFLIVCLLLLGHKYLIADSK